MGSRLEETEEEFGIVSYNTVSTIIEKRKKRRSRIEGSEDVLNN
jgi:hypothetical protein